MTFKENSLDGEILVESQPVSWRRNGALRKRPIVLLAHGAGAPYTSNFMETVAIELEKRKICVVRFHFPYMEKIVREGRRRPPDRAPRLLATCAGMVTEVISWLPKSQHAHPRLVVGGKSMGGRMMSMLLAAEQLPVAAAFYLGYPLHPPGRTEKLRAEHLPAILQPQLFISGSRDPLAKLELLNRVVHDLGSSVELEVIKGGNHSLAVSRKDPWKGSEAWLDLVAQFVMKHT